MPAGRYRSIQSPRMYRALRRRGFSKEAAARISNARTKGHTVKAEPTPGGAIAKPTTGGRKLTRSEVARLGALARAGKYKGRGRQKGGGAKPTPEQRAAEREAKRRQAAQQNRADVLAKMGVDQGDVAAMEALASGTQPENTAALERAGLVERAKDGTARLTAQGRVAYNAASRGDAGAAGDALSRAKDRVTPAEKPAAEKPKGGGGGGKGGKPSEEEKARAKAEQRAKTAQQTAESLGLPDRSADELRRARDEGGVASPALQRLGLIDAEGNTTDQGRRALTALELGKPGDYRAAVQDARNRMTREAAASERRAATEARRGEREAARAARQRRMDRREALRTLGETQKAVDTYDPPESARNNARRGLALRKRWGRGGTAVGVARARDLMNGRSLPYSTVARMASFNRHRQHALDGRKESDGGPSAAYIAWLLWGGTTGVDWARGITGAATKQEAWERAMFANMGSSGGGGGGGGKPTGGTGGLWARNPETGKRDPSMGLEKGAPPPKPGTARAQAAEGAQRAGAPKGDDSPAATATPTRRFSSPDAADAHLRETMGGIKTTRTEAEALEYYQGGRFQAVNDHLRGVNVLKPGQGKEVVEQQIGGLRSVMNRSATTDNLEVYRGMQVTKSEPRARELLNKWQPGATFREDGFLSTTVDPKIAEGFSGNHTMWSPESGVSAVNVRIRVPAGTPAVYMNAARPRGNTEERELLLRDGLTYRVVSRVERPGGQVDVELEVMP